MARILGWCGLSWTEQEKIPPLWHRLFAEPDSWSKLALLQMYFSPQKTKDPDLQFQVTDQIAKDFAKLYLGRGLDLSFNTCHHSMSPFVIIPLS